MNPTFYTTPEEPREPSLLPQNLPNPADVRRHFSKIGLAYLVLMAALMAGSYLLQFLCLLICPQVLSTWWFTWVLSLVPLYGMGLPLMWLVLRHIPTSAHNTDFTNKYRVTDEKPPFGLSHWMILLVIGFGCMYAGGLAGNIIMAVMSGIMDYNYANGLETIIQESPLWMTLIGTCVCAPFGEELLFRKLLIDRTRGYGDLTSILLSGLLFALFHGNLFQFFYAFLLGMILAYIYTRSGNLWWCVAMHAVVNFMGSILLPGIASILPADGAPFTSPLQILATLFLVFWQYGLIIAAVVLICVLWSRRKLSAGKTPLYRENGPVLTLFNPGMVACLAIMCLLLAINLIPVRA